jgi:hypothetical protein
LSKSRKIYLARIVLLEAGDFAGVFFGAMRRRGLLLRRYRRGDRACVDKHGSLAKRLADATENGDRSLAIG